MNLKIVMDSGKEYTINSSESSAKGFYNTCFNEKTGYPEVNTFYFNEGRVLIDPRHISSIEEK